MTLTDFLLARIAEDEDQARGIPYDPVVADLGRGRLFVDHPRRLLAECEAKRQIVGMAYWDLGSRVNSAMDSVLHALALPYADHSDYREEWRP